MCGQQPAPTREVLRIKRLPNSEQGQGAEQDCSSAGAALSITSRAQRATLYNAQGSGHVVLHRGLVTSFDGI